MLVTAFTLKELQSSGYEMKKAFGLVVGDKNEAPNHCIPGFNFDKNKNIILKENEGDINAIIQLTEIKDSVGGSCYIGEAVKIEGPK